MHASWQCSALAPLGEKSACFEELGSLVNAVAAQARSGDHVLVMSNGGFGGIHAKLLDALKSGSTGYTQREV
jgi:UDP-N-acetylmuramate: L-alanyl-gamma-D-glutamyl-meso-diaminopimelate ligase